MGKAPGKRPVLRLCRTLIPSAVVFYAMALGAAAQAAKPASPLQRKDADSSDFVGAEVCAGCHQEEAKAFGSNPLSKLALENGKTAVTCEACFGAGKAPRAQTWPSG